MPFLSAKLSFGVLLLCCMMRSENAFGFTATSLNFFGLANEKARGYQRGDFVNSRSTLEMNMGKQAFNPFSERSRNFKVRWWEADLNAFYAFVETQPLLTADQEMQFGKAMRMFVQVEQMRAHMSVDNTTGITIPVSNEELAVAIGCSPSTLGNMSRYAGISKTRLINSNLKLVLAVVSRYRTAGIPNAELIAEGTRGLSKAVLRYDYSKGFRFATYATWYVHQAIADYVRWRKHPAKMPSRYLVLQRRVRDFSIAFKNTHGRQPSVMEISQSLTQKQYDIIKVMTMQTYPALLGTPAKSMNTKIRIDSDKERTLGELIPSLHKPPLAITDSKDLRRDMENMLIHNLNDVERDVLRLRLGLDDGRVKPVKEVGKRFKITWKEVRTVEKVALGKLLCSEEITEFVESYNRV